MNEDLKLWILNCPELNEEYLVFATTEDIAMEYVQDDYVDYGCDEEEIKAWGIKVVDSYEIKSGLVTINRLEC